MEGIGSMRSHWCRGAQADIRFVRFAYDSSDGVMSYEGALLLYDLNQQGLIQLDEVLQLTC